MIGAAGFIGKVLIEKLLYSCPDVKRIYALIRAAKGKSSRKRLIYKSSRKPFNMVLKQDFVMKKLVSIDSDIVEPKLGPTQKDILTQEVDIIFHVAASVALVRDRDGSTLKNLDTVSP